MPTQPNEDWISEEEVATTLNVPREKIRAERPHLKAGETTKKGNAIVWLRSAAERIASKLRIPSPEKNAPPAACDAKKTASAVEEELTVSSQPLGPGLPHFPQAWLIKAKRSNGEVVVVRVVDSRKYFPKLRTGEPMKFKAQKSAAGNWWQLTGREPRFPGQW